MRQRSAGAGKGLLAGAVGGLAGALAMELLQLGLSKISTRADQWMTRGDDPTHHPQTKQRQLLESVSDSERTSTARAADKLSELVSGERLSVPAKKVAAHGLHYATGIIPGAVYGLVCSLFPHPSWKRGVMFGMLVWLLLNETAIPALKLSKPPNKFPPSFHLFTALTHALYGLVTELARRPVASV